jgi:hypothetical protein
MSKFELPLSLGSIPSSLLTGNQSNAASKYSSAFSDNSSIPNAHTPSAVAAAPTRVGNHRNTNSAVSVGSNAHFENDLKLEMMERVLSTTGDSVGADGAASAGAYSSNPFGPPPSANATTRPATAPAAAAATTTIAALNASTPTASSSTAVASSSTSAPTAAGATQGITLPLPQPLQRLTDLITNTEQSNKQKHTHVTNTIA